MRSLLKTLLASVALLAVPAGTQAGDAVHAAFARLATDIAAGADRHEWQRVRGAMGESITTDYTSYFGGEATTQPADDLVKGWAAFLPGFDATHHLVTNHAVRRIDGASATAEADFTATHRLGDGLWVLGGRYVYSLEREEGVWKVVGLTMVALWETGDASLIGKAAERAAAAK